MGGASIQTRVKIIIGVFIIISGIAYGLFQARELIAGPMLSVIEPINGSTISSPLVEIKGIAQNIAYITINGDQIYTNPEGLFDEKLLAAPGSNIIQVAVKDTFNRSKVKTIELYYKQPKSVPSIGVFSEANINKDAVYQ